MKYLIRMSLFIAAVAGRVYGDSMPVVMMSAKMITPLVPSITFTLKNPSHDAAKTCVFTMTGEEVAELSALSFNRFVWDGKTTDQEDVAPGFYVIQIQQNGAFWHSPVIVKR